MISKITCRYSFEVSIINSNGFGFINKTWVGYLFIYDKCKSLVRVKKFEVIFYFLEESQDRLRVMVDIAVKKYVDATVEKYLKVEGQNAVDKTAEINRIEDARKREQAAADASLEIKRYVGWEMRNAVSELKNEMRKLVEMETQQTQKALAELTCELQKSLAGEAANTINAVNGEAEKICQTFINAAENLKYIENGQMENESSTDAERPCKFNEILIRVSIIKYIKFKYQ